MNRRLPSAPALVATLCALLLIGLAAPAAAQPAPNGGNVTSVTTTTGQIRMLTGGRWQERGSNGGRFDFTETGRDQWSVYLVDPSRGVRLQLDLHTRKVMYADASAPQMRPLYDIIGATAEVNGDNVVVVRTAVGSFRMTGPGAWIEQGNDGGRFNFTESRRDDWSVYLVDRSRGVELQLDLFTRKVMYNEFGQPRRPLYDITSSSAAG